VNLSGVETGPRGKVPGVDGAAPRIYYGIKEAQVVKIYLVGDFVIVEGGID
jgi:hypothetical protein